jgi:DNA polymerase-1
MSVAELELRADTALRNMFHAQKIACDTETTGKELIKDGRHFLQGVSCAWRDSQGFQSFYFPFRHKHGDNLPTHYAKQLETVLSHESKTTVWHNMKFDAHSGKTIDWDFTQWESEFRDTAIQLHYLNENLPKELDWAARTFLNDSKVNEVKRWANVLGWENIPSHLMDEYARHDAVLTYRLDDEIYWPRLKRRGLHALMPEAMQYALLLYSMEQEGVGVNLDFCAEMSERGDKRMAELRKELGFDPAKSTQLGKFLLEDLGLPIVKYTKNGNPSFDKEALAEYDELLAATNNSAAKLVLQYRGWGKAVSSLYLPMQKLVSPDGRIRTNLNQVGTVTGRLSSDSPNLQQIPRSSPKEWNGRAKLAFHAGSEDYVLIGYDYSQLELRLAAHYGQDVQLIEEFAKEKADPFRPIAEGVFGAFNEETRQKAKTFTYATNYGAGKKKVASQLGVTMEQIHQIYDNYQASFPGIFKVADVCSARIKSRGYIKYWTGRRRHITDRRKDYIAFNSLLQGGGAELVKKAQLASPNNEECKQVLQVHDEIAWRVRRDKVEEYTPQIIEAMTNFPEITVPLKVEGKAWASE